MKVWFAFVGVGAGAVELVFSQNSQQLKLASSAPKPENRANKEIETKTICRDESACLSAIGIPLVLILLMKWFKKWCPLIVNPSTLIRYINARMLAEMMPPLFGCQVYTALKVDTV